MKKSIKCFGWILCSLLAAWAPGMDLSIQRKLRPDAFDLGGYLHQAIGRTFDAVQTDSITLIAMMIVMLWLVKRYLYHKPRNTGFCEYVLPGFFSIMQLINTSLRHTGSIQTLYANMFQVIKAGLYLVGMYVLLLCSLRALNELVTNKPWNVNTPAIWNQRPFLVSFIALTLAWLPHLMIKYPGALTIDTVLQFHQYVGWRERTTPHPPFGQVIYGWLIKTALESGKMNLFYFGFTLIKTLIFIAVLSYTLVVMCRIKTPGWICWLTFGLFAVSPIYVGWTTTIGKDSSYLIACMMTGVLMLEVVADGLNAFIQNRWKMGLLAVTLILMMLIRHNGILIAAPLLGIMLFVLFRDKMGKANGTRFALYACMVIAAAIGIEQAIIQVMDIEHASQDDWMAILVQQTGRVVTLHDSELPEDEKEVIGRMFNYDQILTDYREKESDSMRYNKPEGGRTPEIVREYIRVWWKQLKRYPVDYLDAMFHLNGVLFDLQDNHPYYVSLTDNSLDDHVYQYSFNDMSYYNSEALLPMNSLQRALTEWYFRFSELPLIGPLASMGFCMALMLNLTYLCVVNNRRKTLYVMLPSLVTGVFGVFCPIVFLRYLLPMVGGLPLWFAAYEASR